MKLARTCLREATAFARSGSRTVVGKAYDSTALEHPHHYEVLSGAFAEPRPRHNANSCAESGRPATATRSPAVPHVDASVDLEDGRPHGQSKVLPP